MDKINKHKKVLEHLQIYGKITSWEAITNYRATRLSGIVYNLRKYGHDIETINHYTPERYGEYIYHGEMRA